MAEDRITFSIQRTLQVVGYEPIVYNTDYSTDVKPDESVQDARDRCHREVAKSFKQVQDEVVAIFGCDPQVELTGPASRPTKTKKAPPRKRKA
jgi:hypothetical protein